MKLFRRPSQVWFIILSEFPVNIGAGWIGVIILDPRLETIQSGDTIGLTWKVVFAMVSLFIAKILREGANKWK